MLSECKSEGGDLLETEAEQGLQEVEEGSTNTGRKGWGERETLRRSSGLVIHQGQRLILRKGGREEKSLPWPPAI